MIGTLTHIGRIPRESMPKSVAVCALIVCLIVTPFPLGLAISWGGAFFAMEMSICWLLWCIANFATPTALLPNRIHHQISLALVLIVLTWALIQVVHFVPNAWIHPIWQMASDTIDSRIAGAISINPWQSIGGILKLSACVMGSLLAFSMARSRYYAALIYNSVIIISSAYVLYGFFLAATGTSQPQLIYGLPFQAAWVSGPFMLHNSFATYCGVGALAAISNFLSKGANAVISTRGLRRFSLSVLSFAFSEGAVWLICSALLVAGVVASASRAGIAALLIALLTMSLLGIFLAPKARGRVLSLFATLLVFLPIAGLILVRGDALISRIKDLIDAGTADNVRLALWAASERMIASAPFQGLGFGTFQDAYPLYANQFLPFVMDKAHCDYLELAAGLGLPAAGLLLTALIILGLSCLYGAFNRRRDRHFAITGFCASVLVAVHSSVDFSLQLPGVALSYIVLLGVGVAQSQRTAATGAHAYNSY